LTLLAMAGMVVCLFGCRTTDSALNAAIARFDAGEADQAIDQLSEAEDARKAEKQILSLNHAVAELMSGNPDRSEARLREVRKQMDFLAQRDVKESATAVLTDDQAVAWSGREFERRMVDNLLVVSNLMSSAEDAFAYSSQAITASYEDRKSLSAASADSPTTAPPTHDNAVQVVGYSSQQPAADSKATRPPSRFAPNSMAAYLHAAVQSELPTNSDIADRAIQQIGYWNTTDSQDVAACQQGLFGTRTQQGHGALHVVTLVGRITPWEEERAEPTSAALLIADRILSAVGDHSLPPTVAAVKIARPRVRISTDRFRTGLKIADTQQEKSAAAWTLVDLNRSAWDSYQADRNDQIARAVARRVIKKGAVYAAKDQLAVSKNSAADLLVNLGGIAWEAMEKADTRYWHLLPERIEINQIELPAGRHQAALQIVDEQSGKQVLSLPTNTQRQLIRIPVVIEDGRNTFVVCFRSDDEFLGNVLIGGQQPQVIHVGP
jgi:hypothetical protein